MQRKKEIFVQPVSTAPKESAEAQRINFMLNILLPQKPCLYTSTVSKPSLYTITAAMFVREYCIEEEHWKAPDVIDLF